MNTTNNKAARQPKPLTELTLLNRFLFNEVMEQPENLRVLLEIILGKEILLKYLPETERKPALLPFTVLSNWMSGQWKKILYTMLKYSRKIHKTFQSEAAIIRG